MRFTDEVISMIASGIVAGGYCKKLPTVAPVAPGTSLAGHDACLCCGDQAFERCLVICNGHRRFADWLQSWVYGDLGCGYHTADIRRGELGMALLGESREAELLDRFQELLLGFEVDDDGVPFLRESDLLND